MIENCISDVDLTRRALRTLARELGATKPDREMEMSFAEGHCLFELREHSQLSVGAVADAMAFSQSSASRLLKKLQAKGWVRYKLKNGDDRTKEFELTPSGKSKLSKLDVDVDSRLLSAIESLTPAERRCVVQGIRLISSALQTARKRSTHDEESA